jgi:hypothetical protein
MSNHQLLDNVNHAHLKVDTRRRAELGDNISLTGIFTFEFQQVQDQYPIFFKKTADNDQFEPVALFGFSPDENLFLAHNGWKDSYLPYSIQRQPFLIGYQNQQQDGQTAQVPVVHIDLDSPRVNDSEGQAIFLEAGGRSPYLEHINEVLMGINQGYQYNQGFVQALVANALIEPFTLEIELDDGNTHTMSGLYTINEERLNQLDSDSLFKLHQQGYLQSIYMTIASMSNLQRMIGMKNGSLAV